MHTTNYFNTFIAVAEDSTVSAAVVPPSEKQTVTARTYEIIHGQPYAHTSDDVIFAVWADRQGIAEEERSRRREEFFSKGQPCLRASDLGKKLGWGVHSDAEGRVALYGVDSPEYAALAAGKAIEGQTPPSSVKNAMRTRR